MQQQLNFSNVVHQKENNSFSEQILFDQYERLGKQCELVLKLLKEGKRLTVRGAMVDYGISSLPRRILDLKRAGIEIQGNMIGNGFKEYYL